MVQEANEWDRFIEAIGRTEPKDDPRFAEPEGRHANAPALTAILDEVFQSKSLDDWRELLDRHEVTFGVVARIEELPDDAQMRANGVFREIAGDPDGLRTVDSPIYLDGAAKRPPTRAPEIGEHSVEILKELGYTAERIESLRSEGAVRAG
jgi:formyl-CoA transferase